MERGTFRGQKDWLRDNGRRDRSKRSPGGALAAAEAIGQHPNVPARPADGPDQGGISIGTPIETTRDLGRRRGVVGSVVLGLAVGLANLPKAVHIDDTLYLAIARQILVEPFNPYGGLLNWQQIEEPTYKVSISPPLISYYLAAVIGIAGDSDLVLHAAMIPWAVLAAISIHSLGRRWVSAGGLAALLVLASPMGAVGMNLMLDVPLLACTTASIAVLAAGVERPRMAGFVLLSGILAGMAVLIKYPALALVLVLAVLAIERRRPAAALAAIPPILAFLAWQSFSRHLYGASQVAEGMQFLTQFQIEVLQRVFERTASLCVILAMTFPLWIALLASRRLQWFHLLAAGGCALLAWLRLQTELPHPIGTRIAFTVGVFLGSASLLELLAELVRIAWRSRRPAEQGGTLPHCTLATWIVGYSAIAIGFAPFVAVRGFLPVAPALAMLLLSSTRNSGQRSAWIMVAVSVMVTGGLAWTDARWAGWYRSAARELAVRYRGANVYFLGHWGWQDYAQREGWTSWDARWVGAPAGSIILIPTRADKQFLHPIVRQALIPVDRIELPANPLRLTTWNRDEGLRFYGGDFGEIPWGYSTAFTERIDVVRAP